jgi:hypothetical protein
VCLKAQYNLSGYQLVDEFNMTVKFKENPAFRQAISEALGEFTDEFSLMSRKVIEEERLWDNWVTSNPLRDIVDSNALNLSMLVSQVDNYRYRVSWFALYAAYVYFGHQTQSGKRIPPRRWADIAVEENPVLEIFAGILRKKLNQ